MKLKLLATAILGVAMSAPVAALEIGVGSSHTVTNVKSKTQGVSLSIDRVNGIEVNRLKKGTKKAKRVTHYGSLDKSIGKFKEKTRTRMTDNSRFMYVGDLVTGSGNRTIKSKTIGKSFSKDLSLNWYSGFEKNKDGAGNFSKERFSGFASSFSGTTEKFSSKTATRTHYHFSE